jgi:two-component system, NtrC family, sensor kinase
MVFIFMKTSRIAAFILIFLFALSSKGLANPGLIKEPTDDTTQIRILNQLALTFYLQHEYDSCLQYASEALKLAQNMAGSERAKQDPIWLNKAKVLQAQALRGIARGLTNTNHALALDTLQVALLLMDQAGSKEDLADIYSSIADVYDFHFHYEPSLKNHLKSVQLYREAGNTDKLASELTYLAIAQRSIGKYGDALENLMESLKLSKQSGDSATMVSAYLAMGFIYLFVEKWDDALNCQREGLAIYEKMNDTLGIAIVHNDMGVTYQSAGKLDLALKHHQAALKIRLNSTGYYYTSASYTYIGEIYNVKGNYLLALEHFEEALKLAERSGLKASIIDANLNAGYIHFKLNDTDEAMRHFRIALDLSRKNQERLSEAQTSLYIAQVYLSGNNTGKAIPWLKNADKVIPESAFWLRTVVYEKLAECYLKIGDYKNAYNSQLLYSQVKDSLVSNENRVKITTLANRLEIENKQVLLNEEYNNMLEIKQSEIKRQRIYRNFVLLGMFVVLMSAVVLYVRYVEKNRLNTKLNNLLSDLKSSQSQLVQAEKMASLGQLIAGIAHEINTPLGAIKASIGTIADSTQQSIRLLPELVKSISENELRLFMELVNKSAGNTNVLTSKEEREIRRKIAAKLETKGIAEADYFADILIDMGMDDEIEEFLPLFKEQTLQTAYHLSMQIKNSQNIAMAIGRASKIVFALKNYARSGSDQSMVSAHIEDGLETVLILYQNQFKQGVSLNKHYETVPAILCYPDELNQVWTNLMHNAIHAMDGKGELSVHVKMHGTSSVLVSISDTGKGIPPEIKDRIFDAFYTTKGIGEGSGLGLYIVKQIIDKHKGKIWVESTLGKGSAFFVEFPI